MGAKIPQARVSFLVDVLNNLTIDAQIESDRVSEQQMFESHFAFMNKTDLLTADANYGYFRLLKLLINSEISYCIRINHNSLFIRAFLLSGKKDIITQWRPLRHTKMNCEKHNVNSDPITVRLVRVDLPNGKTEVLILSLLDQKKYSYDSIKELYNLRWGVEEQIKKYMQRLIIEFFSSLKINGVLQDFYANIFMLNIVSLLTNTVAKEVHDSSKNNKFYRQINWTSALGDVRRSFVSLFLRTENKINSIINSLYESFKKNTEAIRPNRIFPRDSRKKGSRQKAFMQYKPAW